MTQLQKKIIKHLFQGCTVVRGGAYGYRLLDENKNPVLKFHKTTLAGIEHVLRVRKNYTAVLDLRKVRQLSGHTWIKKQYKTKAYLTAEQIAGGFGNYYLNPQNKKSCQKKSIAVLVPASSLARSTQKSTKPQLSLSL